MVTYPSSFKLFLVFMNGSSRFNQGDKGVGFRNVQFLVDRFPLASSSNDLQHVLEQFKLSDVATVMTINSYKSEDMVIK